MLAGLYALIIYGQLWLHKMLVEEFLGDGGREIIVSGSLHFEIVLRIFMCYLWRSGRFVCVMDGSAILHTGMRGA